MSKIYFMQFLDIVFTIALLYAIYRGFKNGLFIELASLVALLLGIYIAVHFSGIVKTILLDFVSWKSKYIQITAFALTFLVVLIGIHLLAKLFSNIADLAYLGWLNKLAGSTLSFLKMVLTLSVLIGLIQKINFNNWLVSEKTQEESLFYNPIQEVAHLIYPSLNSYYEEFRNETTSENKVSHS